MKCLWHFMFTRDQLHRLVEMQRDAHAFTACMAWRWVRFIPDHKKKTLQKKDLFCGRGERTRTFDLAVPNRPR